MSSRVERKVADLRRKLPQSTFWKIKMAYKCLGQNLSLGIFSSFLTAFFIGKFYNKELKNGLKISEKLFKYTQQLPKVHSNCSCTTFFPTFLAQLFERFCCLYVPPHFMIKQCSMLVVVQQIVNATKLHKLGSKKFPAIQNVP